MFEMFVELTLELERSITQILNLNCLVWEDIYVCVCVYNAARNTEERFNLNA